MNEEYISFDTTKRFPNFNNILTYIIKQLENIIDDNKNVEEIKHNLSDIVIMMNRIFNENKKNLELINSEITKLRAKTYNISSDKNKKIEFENGVFIGNVINSKKEGKGIFYYNNGAKYEGEYKNDLRNGKGIFYYKEGHIYDGEWENDKKHGRGILYINSGEIYEGEFKEGLFDGFGIFNYSGGEKYIGEFKDNKRNGYGMKFSNNNSVAFCKCEKDDIINSVKPKF